MKSFKLMFCLVAFMLSGIFAFAALDVQFIGVIKQAPDPAAAGNEVTFTVSFKTVGGAVNNYKITGGIGEQRFFERTYASIAADKVKTDSFKFTFPNGGNYFVWFSLDPDHTSGDSNYANNFIKKAITFSGVQIAQKATLHDKEIFALNFLDYSVDRIELQDENQSEVHAKSYIWVGCWWKRKGPTPALGAEIELYVDGLRIPCYSTTCIGQNYITMKRSEGKTWIDTAGNHEFKCVINTANEEINKGNNTMIKMINIPAN